VAGLSVKNLESKLNEHFKPLYKVPPQIRLEIADKRYFIEVRGLVEKPGPMLVKEREQIEDIIRRSGERKTEPSAGVVQIKRGENSFNIDLTEYFQGRELDRSPKWYGGEKVLFLRASTALAQEDSKTIQLIGDVKSPGPLAFKSRADFYHYLVKAGGTTPTSDLDRVEVVRHTAQGPVTTKGSALDIAKSIELEPGDTIILGSNLPGKTERQLQFASVMAGIISAISIFTVAF
jgi:protein involved in polysaccharide export with SLBB domain